MGRWIANEHGPPSGKATGAYIVALAETAEDARQKIGFAASLRSDEQKIPSERLEQVRFEDATDLDDDDPRGKDLTDSPGWGFYGFLPD